MRYGSWRFDFTLFVTLLASSVNSQWVTKKAAEWAISEFGRLEVERKGRWFKGTDRRESTPFITGDGFRAVCSPHICEEENRCRMTPESVEDGQCIFVKSDFFDFFVRNVTNRIPGKYVIVVHNGDLSAPDGQTDAPSIHLLKYQTTHLLQEEFAKGRLLAMHTSNLWWRNITLEPRPSYAHCIPIGFENRKYSIGSNVRLYADTLQEQIVNQPQRNYTELSARPLLLVAFYSKSRVPDRFNVLKAIGAIPDKGQSKPLNPFYNETVLSHVQWLKAIGEHKFVLAPFGHGLDTHRISEILLMGGIPVMRRSGISSCYDDSDNQIRGSKRGSLPIVILDSWADLTKDRLDSEWVRISNIPIDTWDHSRLFINHWLDRIALSNSTST